MNKIPINICLFTSTQGHWGIKTRYLETIEHLNNQIPLKSFAGLFAHIKVSPEEQDFASKMEADLKSFGFNVKKTIGQWSHGQNHQEEYLKDITKLFSLSEVQQTKYSLFLEDDMKIVTWEGKLEDYLAIATNVLYNYPDVISVRIARASNEMQRISNLREKHGIDSKVSPAPRGHEFSYFLANDFSNNPHIVRSRDMRNAMLLINKIGGIPKHSEHGTAIALKLLSNSNIPIAVLNPEHIVARHIGTPVGQEEPLDQFLVLD